MVDFIIVAILLIIMGAAVVYLMKAKKSGVKCIGCPSGSECAHKNDKASGCGGGCSSCEGGCGCHAETNK